MLLRLESRQLDSGFIRGGLVSRLQSWHLGGSLVSGDLDHALAGRSRRQGPAVALGVGAREQGALVPPVDVTGGEDGEDAEHGDEHADEDGCGGIGEA